jgi:hypothetical protein
MFRARPILRLRGCGCRLWAHPALAPGVRGRVGAGLLTLRARDAAPTVARPCPWRSFHGRDLWAVANEEESGASFNAAMACDGRFVMDVLVRDHGNVFWGLPSMVDVGGGAARALAATFPHDATIPPGELGSWSSLRGTCLSTSPRPMPSSRSGNPGLLHLAFAIYIQPLKLNSDVLRCCDLVQWILHGWDDEQCVRILQRWSEAIPAAG